VPQIVRQALERLAACEILTIIAAPARNDLPDILEQVFKIGGQRIACLMQMSNHLVQIVAEARKLRMYEPRHVFVGSFLRREATLSRSSATRPKCTGRMPKASKAGLPGEMEAKTRTGRPFRSAVAVIARIGGCGGSQHRFLRASDSSVGSLE